MTESASFPTLKFKNLKGFKNYHAWALSIKVLSIREKTWQLVSGDEKRPVCNESTPVTTGDADGSTKALKMSEELRKRQMEWDDQNHNAWAILYTKIDKKIWHNFANTRQAHEIWKLAEAKCSHGDIYTVDKEVAALLRADASKSESIEDYINYINRHNNALLRMGKHVDDWILSSIFRNGSTADQDRNLFILLQSAAQDKRDLTFDEMAQALIRQERSVKD